MSIRVLTWMTPGMPSNKTGLLLPVYVAEEDSAPRSLRIIAQTAPSAGDATFDIMVDGVPLNVDNTWRPTTKLHSDPRPYAADTTVALPQGALEEEFAEDFNVYTEVKQGSRITCRVVNEAGAKDISIHLALQSLGEEEELDNDPE